MRLVFLHGPPASGKYTVGCELAARTGYELYHNHLVVDAVLQRYAFGTPGFVAERDRLWRSHLIAAAGRQPPGLIFTFSPENSVPQQFVDWLFDELPRRCVLLFSVELSAREEAIAARLADTPRQQFKKLTDLVLYRKLRLAGAFDTPHIPRTDLRIDTEKTEPVAAAEAIICAANLPAV